jgi:hypothetical protein
MIASDSCRYFSHSPMIRKIERLSIVYEVEAFEALSVNWSVTAADVAWSRTSDLRKEPIVIEGLRGWVLSTRAGRWTLGLN